MKDSLGNLFRERFHGHEVPVAPGTWQAIQSQMATSVPTAQESGPGHLQEKFAGHEVHVDPAVWQNISTQIGQGVAAGTTGGFLGGLGWAAAGLAGLLIAGGLVYTLKSDEPLVEPVQPGIEMVEQPQEQQVGSPDPVVTSSDRTTDRSAQDPVKKAAPQKPKAAAIPSGPGHAKEVATRPEPNEPQPGNSPAGATASHDEERSGPEVVNDIIAEMTEEVEQAVLANPPAATSTGANGSQTVTEPGAASEPEQPTDKAPLPDLFLQNVFTPNGDGVNDTYQITSEGFTSTKIRVFSVKSNQLVFSSNTNEPWTGASCEDGMYMVAVEAMTADGRLVSEGRVVWLNRNSTN